MSIDYPLEPDAQTMQHMADMAVQRIIEHIQSLPQQPATNTENAEQVARSLKEEFPEAGQNYNELLDLIFQKIVPTSFTTAGPGYLAYIPGGGLFQSALADFIAKTTNRFVTVWAAAPGLAQIENNVVQWFCRIMNLPKTAGGFLSSGGSLANFSALVAARRDRLPENFFQGIIYASDQVHHSIQKAAILAGFPQRNVRMIASDEAFRMQIAALEKQIKHDKAEGLIPFCIVGSAGTTNTGAVDDLQTLARIAKQHNAWFHVDAAYGGFFMLTQRGAQRLQGIETADSITLDPHKGMFLPYGCGCLLVRDLQTLKQAHSVHAEYLPKMQSAEDFVDFSAISPELSRDWRGLRVWLPVRLAGFSAFRQALDEKLDLAAWAEQELRKIQQIEIVARPQLSILAFRLRQKNLDNAATNKLNEEFLRRINAKKRIFLTHTTIGGQFVIRICVLSFRTHKDRMAEGLAIIRQAAASLN